MSTPEGIDHVIVCQFTGIARVGHENGFAELKAELPLHDLAYARVLNGAGEWSGTLDVEDPAIRDTEWLRATSPYRTAMWVVIDGLLKYGGLVTGRKYTMSTGKVELTGADFWTYLSQRLQARDYANWKSPQSFKEFAGRWDAGNEVVI